MLALVWSVRVLSSIRRVEGTGWVDDLEVRSASQIGSCFIYVYFGGISCLWHCTTIFILTQLLLMLTGFFKYGMTAAALGFGFCEM